MLTQQQIFDKVVQHFLIDKQSYSKNDEGTCMYRSPTGARCAVGLFIPDEEYNPFMDANGGNELIDIKAKGLVMGETLDLLTMHHHLFFKLQVAHDYATLNTNGGITSQETFRKRLHFKLMEVANLFNLDTNLLDLYNE